MRVLLDTHIAVWAALNPARLRESERARLASADFPLLLSAVSVWELRLKWNSSYISGTRKSPIAPEAILSIAAEIGWALLPLSAQHAAAQLASPFAHKDPFDELLLVQAQVEGMRLLNRDARLTGHPCAVTGGSR